MTTKILRADGTTEITDIKSFSIQQHVNTGVDLRPGCVSSAKIDVFVFGAASDAPSAGEQLTCYSVDDNGNETDLGVFYARPAVSSKATYTFTAYDGLKNTDTDFTQRLRALQDSFPMTLGTLVNEALSVAGLTLSGTFPMASMPVQQFLQDGLTCRDILSYAAEIAGRFVRCDENGNVVFDWYKDAENVTSSYAGDWAQGTIGNTTGGNNNSTTRCRTSGSINFDDVLGDVTVTIASGYKVTGREYSGTPASTSNFVSSWADFIEGETSFTPVEGHYYRFVIAYTDNSAITPSDIPDDAVTLSYATSYYRIYPTDGSSETETYIPYKQDGLTYENYETAALDACAVHPSDNESEPVVYPPGVEKTVSGNIINISDGVALSPISLEFPFEYNGTEYLGITYIVTGKNILDSSSLAGTGSGVTITQNADGTFDIDGTATDTTVSFTVGSFVLPQGITSFVFNGNPEGSTPVGEEANYYTLLTFYVAGTPISTVYARGTGDVVVTIPSGARNVDVRFVATGTTPPVFNHATYAPMMRLNISDSSEFEPFGTEYYKDLFHAGAEDVYGGTYNPLTGEVVSTYDPFGNLLSEPVTYDVGTETVTLRDGTNIIYMPNYQQSASMTYYSSALSSGNVISISNNILLAGASYDTLAEVAQNIYEQVAPIAQYRPARINLFTFINPFHIGEIVNVTDAQGVSFTTPIMSLTVAPAAATIESTGNEEYDADSTDVGKVLQNLSDNIIRVNKLKVSWADIDEAIIRSLQTNYLKIIGLLVSGDYTEASALVTQMSDGVLQFYRGNDTQMYAAIGMNQVDDTDDGLHISATDDGDAVSIDFFDGTAYTTAYEADFSGTDPANNFYGDLTLNGGSIYTAPEVDTALAAKQNKLVKIWENSSPTSAFAAQTILNDGTIADYDLFAIKFKEQSTSTGSSEFVFWYTKTSGSNTTTARWVSLSSSNIIFNTRSFSITDSGGISFNAGQRYTQGSSSATTNNAYMVPLEVYGLKL